MKPIEEIEKGIGCGATMGHGLSCAVGPIPQQTILCDPCINNSWLVEMVKRMKEMLEDSRDALVQENWHGGHDKLLTEITKIRALLAELEGK